jgi:hypothetical protein
MSYANRISHIGALAASLTLCSLCLSQSSSAPQNDAEKMSARIESIVQKSAAPLLMKGMCHSRNGGAEPPGSDCPPFTVASAQILISADDIQEMKQYGPQAVPTLSTFLLGENARSERVAIRLLGVIGGAAIVDPLVKVLDGSLRPSSREEALRSLHEAPCNPTAARAIVRAARNDPNAIIRELAEKEMFSCSE